MGLLKGYDAFAFAPLASIGRGWGKTFTYFWTSGIARTNNYSEYLNAGFEAGWQGISNTWFIAYSELLHSFQNGDRKDPRPSYEMGLYSNNLEYFSWELKVFMRRS